MKIKRILSSLGSAANPCSTRSAGPSGLAAASIPRARAIGLALVLFAGALACSTDDPSVDADPLAPSAPGVTGEPDSPEPVVPLSAPVEQPAATPLPEKEPDATETNFLVPACESDADCLAGGRCVFSGSAPADAGPVNAALAGASADAGTDAGIDGGAGPAPRLGRCVDLPDAG